MKEIFKIDKYCIDKLNTTWTHYFKKREFNMNSF